jgi:arylsulfatase
VTAGHKATRGKFFDHDFASKAPSALKYGALILGLLTLACSPQTSQSELIEDANIVLIIADTLRADHLGAYGYRRPTSPFLNRLARSSVVFGSAVSTSSHTVPSVLSIMSSHYPSQHGNQYFHQTNSFRIPKSKSRPRVPESLPLLAELLSGEGFETAAVVTNPWLHARYGFNRGFDRYRMLPEESGGKGIARGGAVNHAAGELLDEFGSDRFFLYLHYMDIHSPYQPLPPYKKAFVGNMPGKLEYTNGPAPDTSEQNLRYTHAYYEAGIRGLDAWLQQFYQELRKRGLDKNTLIVFVSDHGEEFKEHGGLGHGWTLYEEQLRLAFFLSHPALASGARQIVEPVSGVDVLPTLLDLIGVKIPRDLDGISLAPWVLGNASTPEPPRRILLSELATLKAARKGSKKLIWKAPAGSEVEAFSLSSDPKESLPIKAPADWMEPLEHALGNLTFGASETQMGTVETENSEAEQRMDEQLELLGYIEPKEKEQ